MQKKIPFSGFFVISVFVMMRKCVWREKFRKMTHLARDMAILVILALKGVFYRRFLGHYFFVKWGARVRKNFFGQKFFHNKIGILK